MADLIPELAHRFRTAPAPPAPTPEPASEDLSVMDIVRGVGSGMVDVSNALGLVGRTFTGRLADIPGGILGMVKSASDAKRDLSTVAPILESMKGATPVDTAKFAGSMVVGKPVTESITERSLGPIAEDPGGALFDTLLAPLNMMPAASGAAAVTSAARAGKLGRRTQSIIEPLASRLDPIINKVIPKYMHTDATQVSEAMRQGEIMSNTVNITGKAVSDARELHSLYPQAMEFLEPKIVKRGGWRQIDPAQAARFNALNPDAQRRVVELRKTIDDLHMELHNRGLIDPKESALRFGRYLHTMYEAHYDRRAWIKEVTERRPYLITNAENYVMSKMKDPLNPTMGATPEQARATVQDILRNLGKMDETGVVWQGKGGPFRNELNVLLNSRRIPEPIKKLLGPMAGEDMAIRVGHTIDHQIRMLALDNSMERLTRLNAFDGRPLIIPPGKKNAKFAEDYLKLDPELSSTAKWANAQIHPDIYDAVVAVSGDRITGTIQRYMQAWKAGVVTHNVPTHITNLLGSVGFSILAGNSVVNPRNMGFYEKAVRELATFALNNQTLSTMPELQEAARYGAVVPGFTHAELGNMYAQMRGSTAQHFLDAWLDTVMGKGKGDLAAVARGVMTAYDTEDQIFRYATYLKNRQRGMSPQQAALEVNKYYPNYEVTSRVGRFARGEARMGGLPTSIGQAVMGPFTSFPLETMRIYANAAREHPFRVMAAQTVPMSMAVIGATSAGMSPQEYWETLSNAPTHAKGRPLIPFPGDQGVEWLDLGTAWPLSNWFEQDGVTGLPLGPMKDMMTNGLAWNVVGMLPWINHNFQRGDKFYDPARGDDWTDVAVGTINNVAPLPSMVKRGIERTKAAVQERPTRRYGPVQRPDEVVSQTLFPMSDTKSSEELEAAGQAQRKGKLAEARRRGKSARRDPSLSEGKLIDRLQNIADYIDSVKGGR